MAKRFFNLLYRDDSSKLKSVEISIYEAEMSTCESVFYFAITV